MNFRSNFLSGNLSAYTILFSSFLLLHSGSLCAQSHKIKSTNNKKKVDNQTKNYDVLDENPENLSNLIVGPELLGTFGDGDNAMGFGLNGSFRFSGFGELNSRYSSGTNVNDDPYYSEKYPQNVNAIEFDVNFVKYLWTNRISKPCNVTLKLLGAYSSGKTVFYNYSYCKVDQPRVNNYGLRLGLLDHKGSGFIYQDMFSVRSYETVSLYAGFQLSSRQRIVIDYKDCGIRYDHKVRQHYIDLFYAPYFRINAVQFVPTNAYNNYTYLPIPTTVTTVPFGVRMGWRHYVPWGQTGKFARTSMIEIGFRPVPTTIDHGFHFTIGWGICFTGGGKTIKYTSRYEYVDENLNTYYRKSDSAPVKIEQKKQAPQQQRKEPAAPLNERVKRIKSYRQEGF